MRTLKIVFLILILNPLYSFSQGSISSFYKNLTTTDVEITNGENTGKLANWLDVNEIKVYGAGNVLGLVTGAEDSENNTSPTGSLGINFTTNRLTTDLFFSYNSKQKVELNSLGDFGNTLMNPNLGGQSVSLKSSARLYKNLFGASILVSVADNVYVIDENEIDASPFTFKIGGYINPFRFSLENKVQITLDLNYTHRSILGDFSNEDQTIDGNEILARGYNGLDLSLNSYLNDIHLFVQFSFNEKDKEFLLPGFSGTQVLFGLEVSGNFIKLK